MDQSIEVINRQRLKRVDRAAAVRLARETLKSIGRAEAIVTIAFIRDRVMKKLNRDFRGIDRPTDVLSFAYHESDNPPPSETTRDHLGDVVISVETAERYAEELGLSFDVEIAHLVIHGVLHLAGYDHETDDGEMTMIEKRLRKRLLNQAI